MARRLWEEERAGGLWGGGSVIDGGDKVLHWLRLRSWAD